MCAAHGRASVAAGCWCWSGPNAPGKKILISGGGRCNFTNVHAGPEDYLCGVPDFPRSALARYTPEDFVALVEKHGIAYHEKKLGQLFCDGSSRQIVEMLLAECAEAGVSVRTGLRGGGRTSRAARTGFFACGRGTAVHRRALAGRCHGGLSFPKLGGSDLGHRLAQRFGLRIVPPRPGLVPLTFEGDMQQLCAGLSGVAVPCAVQTCGVARQTHFSRKPALHASGYERAGDPANQLLPARRERRV